MKEIVILHLYGDTLDLYGDFFNVTCITSRLDQLGIPCRVIAANLGEPFDPMAADLIYLGHGKARNLAAVAGHFLPFGGRMREAVEADKLVLCTGSSRLLFGQSFQTFDGREQPGIGLFDYTAIETGQVFTGDVVAKAAFDPDLTTYGFINRTAHLVGKNTHPLFRVIQGPGDGEAPDGLEGTFYHNFFGTWQMGPLLARNPGFLREILRRLLGPEVPLNYDDALEQKALRLTLGEFKLS